MWIRGRQLGCDYLKFKVFQTKSTDCWLIKYPPDVVLPIHKDRVKDKKHYRLNVVLKGRGDFSIYKVIWSLGKRIILFRPDMYGHGMKNGNKERLVLSLGWVTNK